MLDVRDVVLLCVAAGCASFIGFFAGYAVAYVCVSIWGLTAGLIVGGAIVSAVSVGLVYAAVS